MCSAAFSIWQVHYVISDHYHMICSIINAKKQSGTPSSILTYPISNNNHIHIPSIVCTYSKDNYIQLLLVMLMQQYFFSCVLSWFLFSAVAVCKIVTTIGFKSCHIANARCWYSPQWLNHTLWMIYAQEPQNIKHRLRMVRYMDFSTTRAL